MYRPSDLVISLARWQSGERSLESGSLPKSGANSANLEKVESLHIRAKISWKCLLFKNPEDRLEGWRKVEVDYGMNHVGCDDQ